MTAPQAVSATKPASNRALRGTAPPRRPRHLSRLSLKSRYSIFVGLMKVVLPATAAALILLVVAWPQLTDKDSHFRFGLTNLAPQQAESLTMLNARYSGIDKDNQPYTVTADMATQASGDADEIDLALPKANLLTNDGAWLSLSARSGRYHREAEVLDLAGSVSLFHDKGFELRTESARIDLAQGTAAGDQAVEGQGTAGTITGEGFRVLDRGERIIFTGKSYLLLRPEAKELTQ